MVSLLLRTTAVHEVLRERVWKPGRRWMRFTDDFQLQVAELESSPRCVLLLTELTPLIAWLCYPKSSKLRQLGENIILSLSNVQPFYFCEGLPPTSSECVLISFKLLFKITCFTKGPSISPLSQVLASNMPLLYEFILCLPTISTCWSVNSTEGGSFKCFFPGRISGA